MAIEPVKLHATLRPVQTLSATLLAGVPIPGPPGPPGDTGPPGATGATGPAGPQGLPTSIQDEGIGLTQRATLNFAGIGVTVTDDAANARTVVTVPGGSQTPWLTDVDAAGHALNNVSQIIVNGAIYGGTLQLSQNDLVLERLNCLNAPANQKMWQMSADGSYLYFATVNDSYAQQPAWLQVNRSGASVTSIAFPLSVNVGIGTPSPGSKLSVVGLPTSASGLSSGDIWRDAAAGNVLKIVP